MASCPAEKLSFCLAISYDAKRQLLFGNQRANPQHQAQRSNLRLDPGVTRGRGKLTFVRRAALVAAVGGLLVCTVQQARANPLISAASRCLSCRQDETSSLRISTAASYNSTGAPWATWQNISTSAPMDSPHPGKRNKVLGGIFIGAPPPISVPGPLTLIMLSTALLGVVMLLSRNSESLDAGQSHGASQGL